ncbi:UDP-N-acetylenolpyruvoylglucosamine reductase [subsurface metagenome]
MKFQKNVLLKNYTTFKIGGPAKYFFVAKSKLSLVKTLQEAKRLDLPFFILAGGSNLLISDKGYQGLVIQVKNQTLKVKNNKIYAEAGVVFGQLVNFALKNSLTGFEWAAGIPGTLGGAVFGNAGAFNGAMKDVVREVEVFDMKKNKIRKLKNKDCKFGYRSSLFKKNPNLIILACQLQLKAGNKQEIKKEMQEYLDYRDERYPKEPSAGSIFKNPKNISARELIDKSGLKGKRIGGAEISKVHSNFIVNLNGAKSQDVLKLINLVKRTVDKKSGIKLKEEIIFL